MFLAAPILRRRIKRKRKNPNTALNKAPLIPKNFLNASLEILSEINPERLAQGATFGFDRLVNPATEDLGALVKEMTGGYGADVVIVAAPAAGPQEQALALVRKRGTVCLFASLPAGKSNITFDSRLLHYGELRVVGTSDSAPEHVAKAVEILGQSSFPADKMITHQLPFEGFKEAIELMKSGVALRVVLKP